MQLTNEAIYVYVYPYKNHEVLNCYQRDKYPICVLPKQNQVS